MELRHQLELEKLRTQNLQALHDQLEQHHAKDLERRHALDLERARGDNMIRATMANQIQVKASASISEFSLLLAGLFAAMLGHRQGLSHLTLAPVSQHCICQHYTNLRAYPELLQLLLHTASGQPVPAHLEGSSG